jgi:hypothetical protein
MVMLFTDLKVFFHSLGASAILLSRSFFIPWCFNQSSLPGRCTSYLCKQQTNLKLVNNTYIKKSIMELQFACIDIITCSAARWLRCSESHKYKCHDLFSLNLTN